MTISMLRTVPKFSTIVLLTIATFDLLTTLLWLTKGQAEGNSFFAGLASHGLIWLAIGKLFFLFVPIGILEYARTKRPATAEIGTWVAVLGYAYLYGGHILQLRAAVLSHP